MIAPSKPHPPRYVEQHQLLLYCDQPPSLWACDVSAQFAGSTPGECLRRARASGWRIHRTTRTATCPQCSGRT